MIGASHEGAGGGGEVERAEGDVLGLAEALQGRRFDHRRADDTVSLVSTVSRAEVAVEPTAMAFTRIFGARSSARSFVKWVMAPLAVP